MLALGSRIWGNDYRGDEYWSVISRISINKKLSSIKWRVNEKGGTLMCEKEKVTGRKWGRNVHSWKEELWSWKVWSKKRGQMRLNVHEYLEAMGQRCGITLKGRWSQGSSSPPLIPTHTTSQPLNQFLNPVVSPSLSFPHNLKVSTPIWVQWHVPYIHISAVPSSHRILPSVEKVTVSTGPQSWCPPDDCFN